ncbi:MAG: MarR family transcriptional regulator [Variovorax paradoxus]|uniref:MarR family transcriptional regulator n=1 Tax=Variovorax paradoxus TaxID=34073 RepID=A0A2W5QIE9_VARPD|nr:MAG: MarR family transcriptional regulator [Variovorax paradoxus]
MKSDPKPSRPALSETAVAVDQIDDAILAFHEAYQAVIAGADARLAEHGLGRSHHKVLYHAARHPRCSVTEVREFVGVTRQAMQRPINDLHRLGLIEMVAMPGNRRVHQLVLTEAGAALEGEVTALLRKRFASAFQGITTANVDQWMSVMKAFAS